MKQKGAAEQDLQFFPVIRIFPFPRRAPPAEPQPIVALGYFLRSPPRVSQPGARKERAEELPLASHAGCAQSQVPPSGGRGGSTSVWLDAVLGVHTFVVPIHGAANGPGELMRSCKDGLLGS